MRRMLPKVPNTNMAIELQSETEPANIRPNELSVSLTKDPSASRTTDRYQFGRGISLDNIEASVRSANIGMMQRITDLSRETIDTDPHLGAILNKRFGSVSSLPYQIKPATGPYIDKEKAKFYAQCVENQLRALIDFKSTIKDLSWALFDGRAASELIWRPVNNKPSTKYGRVTMAISEIEWIHPRRLNFGSQRELRVVPGSYSSGRQFDPSGISLDPKENGRKFVQWSPRLFCEYKEREGLARRCLYYSFFKRYGARERMILLELFGKPWRILRVPNDSEASIDDLRSGDTIINQLGSSYSARLPRGTELDVVQPDKGSGEVHRDIIQETDRQLSKLVLGQIGTTDGVEAGMNSPQANVHQGEQQVILRGDAESLSEVIERDIVDAFIEVNFGSEELAHSPSFALRFDLPQNRTEETKRVDAAVRAGISVSLEEAYEVSGFRMPSDDEAVIRIDQPPTPATSPTAPQPRPVIVFPSNKSPEAGEQLPIPPTAAVEKGSAPPTATVGAPASDKVFTVNEVRKSQGLGPLLLPTGDEDPDGNLTVLEFEIRKSEQKKSMPDTPKTQREETEIEEDTDEEQEEEFEEVEMANDQTINTLLSVAQQNAVILSDRKEKILAAETKPLEWEDSTFGNPEDVIQRGMPALWRASKEWADEYSSAVRGKTKPVEIYNALTKAQEELDLYSYSRPLERSMMHTATLGVLDVAREVEIIDEEGKKIKASSKASKINLATKAFAETAFEKAMKWFRGLSLLPRSEFEKLSSDLKRSTFTVAGVQSMQMLSVAHDELAKHIAIGSPLKNFDKALTERFKSAGMIASKDPITGNLGASHIENVYRTNAANTYGLGRKTLQKQPSVMRAFPVWEFVPIADNRTRETHIATRGKMLLASDPFWTTAYPPYGFQCRCRVAARGPEFLDMVVSGAEIMGLPDPGFTSGLTA